MDLSATNAPSTVELSKTASNGPVEIPRVCRIFGHERWKGSGRCKWCGAHRDVARASE